MATELALAQSLQRRQVANSAAVAATLARAYDRFIDPSNLDGSFPAFYRYARTIIDGGRLRGTVTANQYYNAVREVAGYGGGYVPASAYLAAPKLDEAYARYTLNMVGPVAVKTALSKGVPAERALINSKTTTLGVVKRLTLDAGRRQLIKLTDEDDAAEGWSRVGDGNPCPFCAMLLSRGPVYTSEKTASFQAHDSCGCGARAVFERGDWSPDQLALRKLWDQSNGDPKAFSSAYRGLQAEPGANLQTITKALT